MCHYDTVVTDVVRQEESRHSLYNAWVNAPLIEVWPYSAGRQVGKWVKIGHAEGWDVPLLLRPYYLGITYEYHTTCAIGEQAMPYCEP